MPIPEADPDRPSGLPWPEPEVTLWTGRLPPVPPAHETNGDPQRSRQEEEDKATRLGLRPVHDAPLPLIRPANQRRSTTAFKLFSLLLLLMIASFVAFAGMLFSFYQRNVRPFISGSVGVTFPATRPAPDELQAELRRLKERNRLTLYADQAIANASSAAMANLWRSVNDPELAFVKDGAVAEIVRVQHFYGTTPGLSPDYRIPVRDLFKDAAIRSDADLTVDQLMKLLLDDKQAVEVRTRAAFLLAGHREEKVGNALVEAMRHDADLNVVRAAQNTLQENYELFAPRLFDGIGMENAWKEHLSKASGSRAGK